jgi:hypothetical protein
METRSDSRLLHCVTFTFVIEEGESDFEKTKQLDRRY